MFNKFTQGTIVINKTLDDRCRLVSWREFHCRTKFYSESGRFIPYNLCMWLGLKPQNEHWMDFTNIITMLTHKELDEIEVKNEILAKTKTPNGWKFKIDLSKV